MAQMAFSLEEAPCGSAGFFTDPIDVGMQAVAFSCPFSTVTQGATAQFPGHHCTVSCALLALFYRAKGLFQHPAVFLHNVATICYFME
jgi:hypothetical protein